ncbi:mitochondrial ribosome-associated GTPase 1 isoform X1 [Sus scrofa]|uniref:Mitochondrial ribosome associated GTPase 1 n=3 Tax=Sus scrofa TaxID=9823 RepID=A0A8D2A9I9_PIG|nr:mitochondrial ribosome-associated GTPase 1 isoform X1 [Sus scrofa]
MQLTPRALCAAGRAAFRESFPVGGRDVARWFPGHMAKGLRKMQSSLKLVDCILEVHDARIPLSGRNPLFQETLGLKPHLLVLNKMDLADLKEQQKIMQHLEREGLKNVIFTNCVKDENIKQLLCVAVRKWWPSELPPSGGSPARSWWREGHPRRSCSPNRGCAWSRAVWFWMLRRPPWTRRGAGLTGQRPPAVDWLQIIPKVTELVGSSCRYHRGESVEYCIMVIGVPNVGKSSLINALRRQHLRKGTSPGARRWRAQPRPLPPGSPSSGGSSRRPAVQAAGKATKVGGEPGITRAVMSRVQVCERPLMFLLDTPGVLAPRIQNVETGLKLALCGTVLDHLVGEETLADYLLYTLNRHQLLGYVQHYGLGQACDDITSVLKQVAVRLRKTQKVKVLTGTGDVNVVQPNYPAAARDFLRAFRSGALGPVMLDRDILQGVPSVEP